MGGYLDDRVVGDVHLPVLGVFVAEEADGVGMFVGCGVSFDKLRMSGTHRVGAFDRLRMSGGVKELGGAG